MKVHYDWIIAIIIIDTTQAIIMKNEHNTELENKNIRNKRNIKSTKKYVYEPIEHVNLPEVAKSSEETTLFHDTRIRISLLRFLENNHSRIWNHSIENAIYDPMEACYAYGGIPKLNALESYFVIQRFVDNYENAVEKWIVNDVIGIIHEDKNIKRANFLETLNRQQNDIGMVPYYQIEKYWAWELYHTEKYNKRETALRNSLHVLYIQMEKYLHDFVFNFEKHGHPGTPTLPFDTIIHYVNDGERLMRDVLKKLFLGSIDVLQ